MGSNTWGREVAEVYDVTSREMFTPAVLDPAVDLLAELAEGGPVLELAVGTGRVALPLSARGLRVAGIELSPHMAEKLRAKDHRAPFSADSEQQVAVFERCTQ